MALSSFSSSFPVHFQTEGEARQVRPLPPMSEQQDVCCCSWQTSRKMIKNAMSQAMPVTEYPLGLIVLASPAMTGSLGC